MASLGFVHRPHLHGALDQRERHRLELIIAIGRVFLAAVALVAVTLDPSEPTRYAGLAQVLLVFYDLHGAAVLLLLRFGSTNTVRLSPLLHAIDLVWAVGITFLTEGPNSPFFALFVFVLLAAAYRWGFRETVLTGVVAVILFLLEALAVALGYAVAILELNGVIMRCAYFLLATFLLAYLSEQAKSLRSEAIVVNRLVGKVRVREGLASVHAVLEDLVKLFGGRAALMVLEELGNGRVILWEAVRDGTTATANVRLIESEVTEREDYLFPMPPAITAWEVTRHSDRIGERLQRLALDNQNNHVSASGIGLSNALISRTWKTLLGLGVGFGDEWVGRLFLLDPTARPTGEARLKFLQGVMLHVTPVLHNVYLLRRLRFRIGAIERARVARELHDSVIQSLIGLEMQLDVARRGAAGTPGHAAELTHIQNLLRQEILNVRDLMQQLRPQPADSKQLLERLSDLVDRFTRDTGIDARFVAELDGLEVPPHLCRELMRIVQEGLVNVRKHSGASHVLVRLGSADGACILVIEDDGRGFGFTGSLGHEELAARRVGPTVIRERVETIGGTLLVTSGAGGGARLEITAPRDEITSPQRRYG
jgi:signal transduction histidine kinase